MKTKMTLAIISIVVIAGLLFLTTYFAYEENLKFFGFPTPKGAELVSDKEGVTIYKWSKASEEHGISFIYEQMIKTKGWSKVEREGASTYYEKDAYQIDLISQTYLLKLIIEKYLHSFLTLGQ